MRWVEGLMTQLYDRRTRYSSLSAGYVVSIRVCQFIVDMMVERLQNSPCSVYASYLKAIDEAKPNAVHILHVRRTLDQYYYYMLEKNQERDGDQVVSRAPCQRDRESESKFLTMVDQVWLWVLAGQGDHPKTAISCFPERPKANDPKASPGPATKSFELPYDPDGTYGTTDVLGHIKVHLLDNPSSVGSCHDLAKMIASKCSGAYFNMGSTDERLRFPDIYEMAIGDVVRKETNQPFDEFTAEMRTHRNEASTRKDVMKLLKEVEKLEEDISMTTEAALGSSGLTDNHFLEQAADTRDQAVPTITNSSIDPIQQAHMATEGSSNARQLPATTTKLGDQTDDDTIDVHEDLPTTSNAERNILNNAAEDF